MKCACPAYFFFFSSSAAAAVAAAVAASSSSFPSYWDRVPLQLFHYVYFIYVQLQPIQYTGIAFIVYYDIATRMCVICSYFLLPLLPSLIHLFIHFFCYCSSIRFIFSFIFSLLLALLLYWNFFLGHCLCSQSNWTMVTFAHEISFHIVVCTVKMLRVSL